MARLIVKNDGGTETVELRPRDAVGIGRDEENQIALPDARGASRKHCRITAVPAGGGLAWELTDLGATNKTRVNGKPVDKKVLSSGDVISVGTAEITFEDPQEEERLREAGSQGVCYLEWVSGDHRGEKIWLDTARVTLGRRASNTIALDDRMSSGHHAEIAKDLNGYTIRDLGSTNGTLVNGEPTTEAPLHHGSRVRIGNSRLVFKDPSMKDIEVELSQFEEDEGWGMMGDIDFSRARGSYTGLVIGVLILGLAAVGGWFIMQDAERRASVETAGGADGNLLENGTMEDVGSVDLLWVAAADDAPVRIASTTRGKGHALSLRHTGGEKQSAPLLVTYRDDFPAISKEPMRIQAQWRADGEATLVAIWRTWRTVSDAEPTGPASGVATRLTHTRVLGGGVKTGAIDVVVVKPVWAESMMLGVRLGPGGRAVLDDVRVTRQRDGGAARVKMSCPGDPSAFINAAGDLDLVAGLTVLATATGPVARLADGTLLTEFVADGAPTGPDRGPVVVKGHFRHGDETVSAKITWSRMDSDEGLHADVECAQAAAVGLRAGLLRKHLGVALNVLTADGPRNIQAEAGQTLTGVRKTLCGDPLPEPGSPRTLISFSLSGEATAHELALAAMTDEALLAVRHLVPGSSAGVDVITNYEVQARAARDALAAAGVLVREQPGRGIEALREVKVLYPFIERVRDRAASLAASGEKKARTEIAAYQRALDAFRIFRSRETLVTLDHEGERMAQRYPARGSGNGPLENAVLEIAREAGEARAAYTTEHAGTVLSRLERLADLLAGVTGYEPMAAVYYRTIVTRFGHLEGDDAFGRRVQRAREQFEKLRREYPDAIPGRPK